MMMVMCGRSGDSDFTPPAGQHDHRHLDMNSFRITGLIMRNILPNTVIMTKYYINGYAVVS